MVAKAWAKKVHKKGRDQGKTYYEQVHSGEKYAHRPHLHRRYFPGIEW